MAVGPPKAPPAIELVSFAAPLRQRARRRGQACIRQTPARLLPPSSGASDWAAASAQRTQRAHKADRRRMAPAVLWTEYGQQQDGDHASGARMCKDAAADRGSRFIWAMQENTI